MGFKSGSSRNPKKVTPMQLVIGFIRKHGRRHGTTPKDVKGYLMSDHAMTESQAKKATELCLKRGLEFGLLARKRNSFSLQSCAIPLNYRGVKVKSNCRSCKKHKGRIAARGGRRLGRAHLGHGRSRRGRGHKRSSKGRGRRSRRRSLRGGTKGRRSHRRGSSRRGRKGRGRRSRTGGRRRRLRRDSPEPEMTAVKRRKPGNLCVSQGDKSKEVEHAVVSSTFRLAQKGTKGAQKGTKGALKGTKGALKGTKGVQKGTKGALKGMNLFSFE